MISVDLFAAASEPDLAADDRSVDPGGRQLALVMGRSPDSRGAAARAIARAWAVRHPDGVVVGGPPAEVWPFRHPLVPSLPEQPTILWAPDVHEAFINHQASGTRLVTTQAGYLFEVWSTALATRDDVLLLATANRETLEAHGMEPLAGRGPLRSALVHVANGSADPIRQPVGGNGHTGGGGLAEVPDAGGRVPRAEGIEGLLARAFRLAEPLERLSLCIRALDQGRTAPALLATASTAMEVGDLEAATRDLDEALELAPDWAAAHFERGKLWLRVDDMERASASFREAAERLPSFVSAWANLGATLGELDQPEAALAAFEHARASDPDNHQVLNNLGVVSRELGRLPESEQAFRQVIALAPDLAFGYYNLGHSLFLQGRYHAALAAYAEGQGRDPERNPVQASRLALCKLASGDAPGALRDLQQMSATLPREYRQLLLADTSAVVFALLTDKPDLAGWTQVNDWLQSQLARLA